MKKIFANMLARSNSKESTKIVGKKRTIIIILASVVAAVVCIAIAMAVIFSDEKNVPSFLNNNVYNSAVALLDEGQYLEAADKFKQIPDYKDSSEQIKKIYDRYGGYYQDLEQNCTLYLNIIDDKTAEVVFKKNIENKIIKIEESLGFQNNRASGEFVDTLLNEGNISIILNNDGVEVTISTTITKGTPSIVNLNVKFLIEDKTDSPIIKTVNKKTLLDWVTNLTSINDISKAGYELEVQEKDDFNNPIFRGKIYKVSNTDILLFMLDAKTMLDSGYNVAHEIGGDFVVAAFSPAKLVCPEKIGEPSWSFAENNMVYVPINEDFRECYYLYGSEKAICESTLETTDVFNIEKESFICILSNNIIDEDTCNYLLNKSYTTADFLYEKLSDGIKILRYIGNSSNITIPSKINGVNVVDIDDGAFKKCTSLKSVTIQEGVKNIGAEAFYSCSSLENVTIPNSVTAIHEKTFYGCSKLTSITIPNSVKSIGNAAFYRCAGLTSATIPDSVTTIGEEAFYGCSKLTSITIPNNIKSLSYALFSHCSELTSVTIPDSVTTIGSFAFGYCPKLTNIKMGNNVKNKTVEAIPPNKPKPICKKLCCITEIPLPVVVSTNFAISKRKMMRSMGITIAMPTATIWKRVFAFPQKNMASIPAEKEMSKDE